MTRILFVALAILVGSLHADATFAQAGQVQFASGDVQIQRASGRKIAAFKGLAVEEGDTIQTGETGQAQLRMVDQGLIAMRPNTEIKLEAYRYAGKEDGNERGVIGLFRGAFRSITGAIGRSNRDSYRVRTPSATIGIRGTDHESAYVPPPVGGQASAIEPGTYNKVNAGETFIEANGQRVVLTANQAGFAGLAANVVPIRLPEIPQFMRGGPKGGERGDGRRPGGPREGGPRAGPGGPRPPGPPGGGPGLPPPPPGSLPPPVAGTFDPSKLPPGVFLAKSGTPMTGGDLSPTIMGSGAEIVGTNPLTGATSIALINAAGQMIQFGSPTFNYARNGAPIVDQGSVQAGTETVNWAVYAGGEIKDGMGVRQPIRFHHMIGTSATSISNLTSAIGAGTLSYSCSGPPCAAFTKPIIENGAVGGTVSLASITLDNPGFLRVQSYSITVNDSLTRTWNGNSSGAVSLSQFIAGQGIPLNVSCPSCPGGPSGVGSAHGIPIGNPAPVGVISSYDMKVGTAGVTGSVLIKP